MGNSGTGPPNTVSIQVADKFASTLWSLLLFIRGYIDAIHEAERCGYKVNVIDLTHAWMGVAGTKLVDLAESAPNRNSFNAWREVTPLHNHLVETMLATPLT